jgi:hypothetical protein
VQMLNDLHRVFHYYDRYFETSLVPDGGLTPLSPSNFSAFPKVVATARGFDDDSGDRVSATIKAPPLAHRIQNCLGRCHPMNLVVCLCRPGFFCRGTYSPLGEDVFFVAAPRQREPSNSTRVANGSISDEADQLLRLRGRCGFGSLRCLLDQIS